MATEHHTRAPHVWRAADYADPASWAHQLSPAAVADLAHALAGVRARGLALDDITAADFALPSLATDLAEMAEILATGRGFALLRGIPYGEYTDEELAIILWGIGTHLGVGVSQSQKGDRIGHVQDRGEVGRYYGIGGPIEVHMDPVDVTGLMCLRPAKRGGATPLMSSFAVRGTIAAERPDLLAVLMRGFHYGSEVVRMAGEPPVTPHRIAMFGHAQGGAPDCFYLPAAVRTPDGGPREALCAEEREAMAFVQEVASRPEMHIPMRFEPGEIQFVNNRVILHARTDYEDWPEPGRKRHLLRLWLMVPSWPARPPERQMLRSSDRAGGGIPRAPQPA
jgi:hypothetical protein